MRLIKKYIKELKELRGHEITGRKITDFSNAFFSKARDNKWGSTEELDALLHFAMDINEVAYSIGRANRFNTKVEDEVDRVYTGFGQKTQKELKIKIVKMFKKYLNIN